MLKIYSFFGGRKLYYFNLLFTANLVLLAVNKWQEAFGYFSIGLYAVIVAGVETNKYIKGKNNE